ncbi:MAG: hypothetical protein QM586_03530 [Xenophilus sp.]
MTPIDILTHTPAWVFAVFALLAWLGGRQLLPGSTPLARAMSMPLAMVVFAAHGVVTGFGQSGAGALAVADWAAAAALALATVARVPLNPAVRYDIEARRFHQPGSAVPLALMMGTFLTKYAVGVTLAVHPAYAHQAGFAVGISALYGLFSGVFAGRALRLVRLAMRQAALAAA